MAFQLHQYVEWENVMHEKTIKKRGIIVCVIPIGVIPPQTIYPELFRKDKHKEHGRTMESYIVRVGNIHYWPWPSQLHPIEEDNLIARALSILNDMQELGTALEQSPQVFSTPGAVLQRIGEYLLVAESLLRPSVLQLDPTLHKQLTLQVKYARKWKQIKKDIPHTSGTTPPTA